PAARSRAGPLAGRAGRRRAGTAVTLAALYQPLRLAEELALLDVLSNGRLAWGAGRGFDPREFRAFGVPVEESAERMQESVEVVLAAWREGKLDHRGRYFEFREVEVLPKPQQRPHPPVWLPAPPPQPGLPAANPGPPT